MFYNHQLDDPLLWIRVSARHLIFDCIVWQKTTSKNVATKDVFDFDHCRFLYLTKPTSYFERLNVSAKLPNRGYGVPLYILIYADIA